MNRVHENAVVASLETTSAGSKKNSRNVARAGANELSMSADFTTGGYKLWPTSIDNAIRKPVTDARAYLKEVGVPWSVSRNNANGGKLSSNQYLIPADKLVVFEKIMSGYRMEREQLIQKNLFDRWDIIRREAKTNLGTEYDERHFPDISELRQKFTWEVNVEPLWDIRDIANDVRLKAPQGVIDRAIEDAKRQQSQRITNAMSSIVEDVLSDAETIIEGIDSYEHNQDDRRKGNTLPKGRGWANLNNKADKLDTWAESFESAGLGETADKIRELVKNISDMGGGDISVAREVMGGEDDSTRKGVREKLVDISRTAEKSMAKFDKFMS